MTGLSFQPITVGRRRKIGIGVIASLAAIIGLMVPATTANAALNQPGSATPSPTQTSNILPFSSTSDCNALTGAQGHSGAPLCFWVSVGYVGTMGYYWGGWPPLEGVARKPVRNRGNERGELGKLRFGYLRQHKRYR